MAAKPTHLSLAAASLAAMLMPALLLQAGPGAAQTVVGSGNVQFNPQALEQLGGGGFGSAPVLGSSGPRSYPPIAGRPPLPGEAEPPKPLIGETGRPRSVSAVRLRPPRASTATRPASAGTTAAKPAAIAPAPIVAPVLAPSAATSAPRVETAPAAAPAPSGPIAIMPAQPAPQPVTPAPVASDPAATPAAPGVAPAPVVAPAPAPTNPAPQQSAMVAPRPTPAPSAQGGVVTLSFAPGEGELPPATLAALDGLARQYAGSEDRLQVRAYAANSAGDGGSGARRLSLTRALAVRAYLIDKGIRSTRIDVRALGAPTDGSAADRVEVAPAGR